jgi:c-di-GMP-binding flagellar brake protein YcgR
MLNGEELTTDGVAQTSSVDTSGVLIRGRQEILQLMRKLHEQSIPLTLSLAEHAGGTRGPLIYIDEATRMLLVECSGSPLLDAQGGVLISCVVDGSKYEFQSATLSVTTLDSVPVASIDLPEFVWRFQRRRDARHDTRALHITLNMGFIDADARVTNMSLGGVGVVCCGADVHLVPGEMLHACTISLPGAGEIRADLKVRHVTPAHDKSGAAVMLAGCEFTGMSGHARQLMTHYLDGITGA